MNKLDELKKKHAEMGEEIRKLESEPEGFLGIAEGCDIYVIQDIQLADDEFLSISKETLMVDHESGRGYLNVFKTREQAEAARYVLIYLLSDIKKTLEENISLNDKYTFMLREGKKIAKELGLE